MNPVFAEGAPPATALRSILARMRDTEVSHIVLAVADDDIVRQEAMAELGERLSGRYRLAELDYADPPLPSLPRYYRQLAGVPPKGDKRKDPPICLFAHGLKGLKARQPERYEEALHYLNAHREDLRLAPGAVILWLTTACWEDVQEQAPDFADWETGGVTFALPPGQRIERTALGRLTIDEAEELRREVAGFRELLARPNLGAALAAELTKQRDLAERRLGRVPDPRRDYRLHLADELREHVLRGFAPQVGGRVLSLPLAKIFLPLRALEGRPALAEYAAEDLRRQETAEEPGELDWQSRHREMEKRSARLRERQTAQRALSLKDLLKERRAVLLGDPGSGKTTVSRYVAWALAAGDDTHLGDAVRGCLPILVRMANFGKSLEADPALTLFDYIACQLLPQPAFGACLREAIEAGECLVILDGLDEVTAPGLRAEVTARIQALVRAFGANRFLATSRIVGYERSSLTRDFKHATLRELGDADRERFVELWYAAIRAEVPERDVAVTETELLATLEKKPQIARMAANPLLLTIMVLMHWRGIKLPNRRVQVYQNATDTLIEYWTAERVALDAEEVKQILAPVAHYILSSKVGGVIARHDLLPRLRDGIVTQRGWSRERAEGFCEELLAVLGEQSGIFLERGLDAAGRPVYGFLHQTFGEYLAALHLANEILDGSFELEHYVHRSAWREPLLLLAGHLSLFSRAHASRLLRAILDHPCPYERVLRRNVLLAAECLADDNQIAPRLRDEILRKLADLLFDSASQPRQAAMEIYRHLGRTRHREAAAIAVKGRHETWKQPEHLDAKTRPIALALATALVRVAERDLAEPLLTRLEDGVVRREARTLRLEGWPEKTKDLLLRWSHAGNLAIHAGPALTDSTLESVKAESILQVLGGEGFVGLLEQLERASKRTDFALRWLIAVASERPSIDVLAELTVPDVPSHIRLMAASRLLDSERRSAALVALQDMIDCGFMPAAETLLEAAETNHIGWNLICALAFKPHDYRASTAIRVLLKAGRIDIALSATLHLIATVDGDWSAEGSLILPVVEELSAVGQYEIAIVIARWLALQPGYPYRFEACEALIGAGRIEEAVRFLRFVAYESHGEACQKAAQRLLMLKEPEPVIPILVQLARSAPPDLRYQASLAMTLVHRESRCPPELSRTRLKTMILEERHQAYLTALEELYEIGIAALGENEPIEPQQRAGRVLGRLSLVCLCRPDALHEETASLPRALGESFPVLGTNLALFEWRGGHLRRARQRMTSLVENLGDESPIELRRWALQMLGLVHGDDATAALQQALHDPDHRIRLTAVGILGELLPTSCTRNLVQTLSDRHAQIRDKAATALGKMRDPSSTAALIGALEAEDGYIRSSMARALGQLGASSSVEALIQAYDEDARSRSGVVSALGKIGEAISIPTLIKALGDSDESLSESAAFALGQMGHPAAVTALVTAVADGGPRLRSAAIRALYLFAEPSRSSEVCEALARALADPDGAVRMYAIMVLGSIRSQPAAPALLNVVHKEKDVHLRRHAFHAFADVADPTIFQQALFKGLDDQDVYVRWAAVSTLGQLPETIRTRALSKALRDVTPWIRSAAIEGLGPRPGPGVVEELLSALRDKDPSVRRAAAYVLAQFREGAAIAPLMDLMGEEDGNIRTKACGSLAHLRTEVVAAPLMAALYDSEVGIRQCGARALGRLKHSAAGEHLLTCLNDPYIYVRGAVAEALGHRHFTGASAPLMLAAARILSRPGRFDWHRALDSAYRDALAAIAQALARLNAVDTLPFLVANAIPHRKYLAALISLDAGSALRVLERFANPLRDRSWPHWIRGHALWRLSRSSKAWSSFRRAAAEDDVDGLLSLALFNLGQNHFRSAVRHVDRAVEKDGRRAISLLTRAVVLFRRGRIDQALEGIEQARLLEPDVTDPQDLAFDHLWHDSALDALADLVACVDESRIISYSEVAEPRAQYDAPAPARPAVQPDSGVSRPPGVDGRPEAR